MGDEVARATGEVAHYIISDLGRLLVYMDVDEGDVVKGARGQPATVSVNALGDEKLSGVVYHPTPIQKIFLVKSLPCERRRHGYDIHARGLCRDLHFKPLLAPGGNVANVQRVGRLVTHLDVDGNTAGRAGSGSS